MVNITIIGDSLALSRINDRIKYQDTYYYKLSKEFNAFVLNASVRGNSSSNIIKKEYLDEYINSFVENDFIIIHVGIVDCSPRLMNKIEKKIIQCLISIPIISIFIKTYIKIKSKNRFLFTKIFKKSEVSIDEFKLNMNKFVDIITEVNKNLKQVIIINIASPNNYIKSRSAYIEQNIQEYNSILKQIADKNKNKNISIIDIYSYSKINNEVLLDDGQHINKKGHDFIFNEIKKIIKEKIDA